MDLRKIIANEMKRQDMTMTDMAKAADMTIARVSEFVNGHRDVRAATAARMLDALGMRVTSKGKRARKEQR